MAIGVRTRPEVVVFGKVQRVVERRKKEGGELYAHDAVVETKGGGVWLRVWLRDLDGYALTVGESVAVVASIEEGQSASLSFVRELSPDDADALLSASGLALSGK